MRQLRFFQIDASLAVSFVVIQPQSVRLKWLDDATLQAIAQEIILQNGFLCPSRRRVHLRGFTPKCEVDMGHATSHPVSFIFTELERGRQSVQFDSRAGLCG